MQRKGLPIALLGYLHASVSLTEDFCIDVVHSYKLGSKKTDQGEMSNKALPAQKKIKNCRNVIFVGSPLLYTSWVILVFSSTS